MDSVTTTEAVLLSKLQSSNEFTDLHHKFTEHLDPFTIHLKRTTTKKSLKSKSTDNPRAIRNLAKQFLPFLHKSLSLIPKRLSESPKIAHHSALELFDAYRLCLNCLELIAPELAGKPYSVQVQRLRYIHSMEHWELYKEAETESFLVLESFQRIVKGDSKGKLRKPKARLVPEMNEESVDQEFTVLVLETVVTLVKCASKNQSKEDADYWRVIALAKESQPWFKVLEAKDREKFHRLLVLYLHRIAMFLVGELTFFEVNLVVKFCLTTFEEYKQSSTQDEMYKFAGRICSSLFSQQNDLCIYDVIDILKCVLNFMATECKVGMEKAILEFLGLVHYCVNKCRATTLNICDAVANYLNELGGHFCEAFSSINLILRLYATGLLMSPFNCQLRGEKVANSCNIKDISALQFLRNNEDMLRQLGALLDLLKGHFNIGSKENSFLHERVSYLSSYCNVLKFLCQPIAECIHAERKQIFAETEGASYWINLGSIQDAFQQFYYIFLHYQSENERKTDTSDDDSKLIFAVVVAALVLSFKTGYNTKESVTLVKHVISINLFPAKRLKYLCVSLHNVAVILNRNKQLKEAVKALTLCCKASWKCVVNLCKTRMDKSNKFPDDATEDTIADFVKEASAETTFLLDLLNQGSNCKMNKIIRKCLESWSVAENLVETLPAPVSVVKYWIKRECKLSKDVEVEDDAMLYSLASSSMEMPKRTLEKLLEQELLVYKEMSSLNPRLCHKMRLKIMDVLLEEVYVTKDKCLEKSRILIEKGRELRADGIAQLNESLQCLSDAISTLKAIYGKNKSCSSRVHHLLVCAFIVRALCTQEAEPNSEFFLHKSNFLQDIQAAVELCSSPNHCHSDEQHSMMWEEVLNLFYITIDLLSVKGYLDNYPGVYDVVIQLFNQKKIPPEKMLAELWKNRRLSHALCASPINELFIRTFSKHHGQFYKSEDFWRTCMVELKPLVAGFDHANDEIKQAASDFISNVPHCSGSMFLSSHLYYDLSERLILNGKLIEALSYAKEAHKLRSKLLHEKFQYSAENQTEIFDENGEIMEKSYYSIQKFQIRYFVTIKGWLGDGISCDYEGCILTPWNVLSCYLESVLQVGIVQEILGDGSEAEMLLRWGKSVSQFQGLPLFEISFSFMLGKLYRKQKFWALAEKELFRAKTTLDDNRSVISCMKCVYALEVTINQQLGDLFLCKSCSTREKTFTERFFHAKSLYRLALEKLNLSEWRHSISSPGKARGEQIICRESSFTGCAPDLQVVKDSSSRNDKPDIKFDSKRSRKAKELKRVTQAQGVIVGHSRRMTRSTYRSLGKSCEITPGDVQIGDTTYLDSGHLSASSVACHHNVTDLETKCYATDFECDINRLCDKMRCWHCLHLEAVESGSLSSFVHMRWELVHRKLSLRLLISIGKYVGICGDIHDAHKLFLQSISVLFSKNSSCSKYSPSLTLLIDSIGTDFPGDVLAVERAALLYYICWFTLKSYAYPDTRKVCCEHLCIGTSEIVSILKVAFLLCCEAPLLFQKISRLLAVLYVLSTSVEPFSLSPSEVGRESQWASFFHQASIGTHLNQQLFYGMTQKRQSHHDSDSDSLLPKPLSTVMETLNSLRIVPESHENLEEFVARFFQDLPCAPVICISLISGADAGLLRELSCCPSTVEAWILVSHLNSENQHVILLPVNTTLEGGVSDDGADSSSGVSFKGKEFVKSWKCPWVSTVVDYIAPKFRQILEGNYYSSSEHFREDTKENRLLWWMKRNRLDKSLSKFLQDMEDLWLGVWKCVLLGEWPNLKHLDSIEESLCEEEKRVLRIFLSKKCYLDVRSEASSSKVPIDIDSLVQSVFEKKHATPDDVNEVQFVKRSPIILVLDFEAQMLPWENLPILRNQEVYRMPSLGSIFATLTRCRLDQAITFPLIDPVDLYYLLNPDGDLNHTQVEFENWFQDQNFEGKSATVPPVKELTIALKNHDLFVYMGHGSGMQYIPGNKIQELDTCAATLLMGCSSGSLSLKGSYAPQGAPISYLLAGSPIIVANLWEVTDKDIDRFGKTVLNAWLRERKEASSECVQCKMRVKKYKSTDCCTHRPRIGSFMGQARDACTLPFLIGASPVCYGVPTGIMRKKNV